MHCDEISVFQKNSYVFPRLQNSRLSLGHRVSKNKDALSSKDGPVIDKFKNNDAISEVAFNAKNIKVTSVRASFFELHVTYALYESVR